MMFRVPLIHSQNPGLGISSLTHDFRDRGPCPGVETVFDADAHALPVSTLSRNSRGAPCPCDDFYGKSLLANSRNRPKSVVMEQN